MIWLGHLDAILVRALLPIPFWALAGQKKTGVRSNLPPFHPFLLQSTLNALIEALQARHYIEFVKIYCFLLANDGAGCLVLR